MPRYCPLSPPPPPRLCPAAARPHVALTGFLLYDNATGGALEVPYGCDEHLGLLQLIDRTLIEATVPAVAGASSILASPPPLLGAADPAASPLSPASSEIAAALRLAVQSFLSRGFPTSDVDLSVGDEEYEEHKQVRGRETERGEAAQRESCRAAGPVCPALLATLLAFLLCTTRPHSPALRCSRWSASGARRSWRLRGRRQRRQRLPQPLPPRASTPTTSGDVGSWACQRTSSCRSTTCSTTTCRRTSTSTTTAR